MKRKFLPVNTSSEMAIDKKRIINIITFDQLKQINGISSKSKNNQQSHAKQKQKQQTRHSLCSTQQPKIKTFLYGNNTPLDQSFSHNHLTKNTEFPLLNTDKLNFRCAFSNICKNTNNDTIGNKITQNMKNKRNTFNCCSAFPILRDINDNNNADNDEEEKCTPKFCKPLFTNYNFY